VEIRLTVGIPDDIWSQNFSYLFINIDLEILTNYLFFIFNTMLVVLTNSGFTFMCNHLIDDVNTSSELTFRDIYFFLAPNLKVQNKGEWCFMWWLWIVSRPRKTIENTSSIKWVDLYLKQACKLYNIYLVWIITGMGVAEWKTHFMNNIFHLTIYKKDIYKINSYLPYGFFGHLTPNQFFKDCQKKY